MKSKHLIMTWLLIISVSVIFGCSGGSGPAEKMEKDASGKPGQVTIKFWHTHNTDETNTINSMISAFEEANPDIKIEHQVVPFSDALNKFKIAAPSGGVPDVFRAEIAWTVELHALGHLRKLDEYVGSDINDYLEKPLHYCEFSDGLFGLPQVTDCLALLYNKRLLSEAGVSVPENMDDLAQTARKLTNAAGNRYGFFMRGDSYWALPFVWAFGGDMVDTKTRKAVINDSGSADGINYILKLRDEYKVMPDKIDFANDYDNMMVGFKSGKYAMILNGPWATADILSGPEFEKTSNLGVARIPKGPDGYASPVGGHNYVITRACKNPEAAYKFVKFLNSVENQALFAIENNLLPTRKSTYDDPRIKNNEILLNFKSVIEVATYRPAIPELSMLNDPFTQEFQGILTGTKTVQQGLDATAERWDELLEE